MASFLVVGAGVAGLGAALSLGRRGHDVVLLERDDTPLPATPDEAFSWDRSGAPQVRHSHAFLARLRLLLAEEHPDVLQALLDAGATPLRFGDALPPTLQGFTPEADDDELTMLACRRTTFEWVLRRAALVADGVTVRTGVAVTGLLAEPGAADEPPTVTGVRLADGEALRADAVVVATGRRSALPEWLEAIGAGPVAEEEDDTGIVYLSRFYKLRDGFEPPPRTGAIGGDLGYLKYGVFVGDNRTFSITLATPSADDELRRRLTDVATFEACARTLVAARDWMDGRSEPLHDGVHMMAGLVNRWRELVPGGRPLALGIHAVGDARLCTNPLYGRGCSTAFWHAHLLAEAIDAHPHDPLAQVLAHEAATMEQIHPWYRASVTQDAEARRVAAALLAGEDPDADTSDPRTFMRAVLRDGLLPAVRTDQVVLRAFMRNLNLLTPPEALATDPEVGARVLAVWQDRDNREPEPPLGPASRTELLALLAA